MLPSTTLIQIYMNSQGIGFYEVYELLSRMGDSAIESLHNEIMWHYAALN